MGYSATKEKVPNLVKECESKKTNLDKALNNMSLMGKYGHILKQSGGHINKMWKLLDSQ